MLMQQQVKLQVVVQVMRFIVKIIGMNKIKLKDKFEFIYDSYIYISQGKNSIIQDINKIRNKKY